MRGKIETAARKQSSTTVPNPKMPAKDRILFFFPLRVAREDDGVLQEARYNAHPSVHLSVITLDRTAEQLQNELHREKWTTIIVECLSSEDYAAFEAVQDQVAAKVEAGCSLIYYRHYTFADNKFLKVVAKRESALIVTRAKNEVSHATGLIRILRGKYSFPIKDVALIVINDRVTNGPDTGLSDVASRKSSGGLCGMTVKNTLKEPIFLLARDGETPTVSPGETLVAPPLLDGSYGTGSCASKRVLLHHADGGREMTTRQIETMDAGATKEVPPATDDGSATLEGTLAILRDLKEIVGEAKKEIASSLKAANDKSAEVTSSNEASPSPLFSYRAFFSNSIYLVEVAFTDDEPSREISRMFAPSATFVTRGQPTCVRIVDHRGWGAWCRLESCQTGWRDAQNKVSITGAPAK
jgi:hypothetical protein